jgi:TrmH family RNA methyltransferase
MGEPLGAHAPRLASVASLLTTKGRHLSGRFSFEGQTLLEEARRSAIPIEELYATPAAYEASSLVRDLDRSGTPTFTISERSAKKLSDLDSPPGIVAVAPMRLQPLEALLRTDGTLLVLADLNDPGNAGTLLRSAEAFGCAGVIFGRSGVDPYHPKVVRAAMGAIFRVPLALAELASLEEGSARHGRRWTGLAADGEPLDSAAWERPAGLVVGQERRGLGSWRRICERQVAIPMPGPTESLNAAVAGSIALYEASRR